jgi:hypothetical protein
MKVQRLGFLGWSFLLLTGVQGCGPKAGSKGPAGNGAGQVEQAFTKAARDYGIPVRYLMAVGYLESHLSSDPATATYASLTDPHASVDRGTVMTQTAFGVSTLTLGLDPAQEASRLLETQIDAYAHWVSDRLKSANVSLPQDPKTAEERFYWIENLALLQRKGVAQRRNVQIVFANELIATLNRGFLWQDPRDSAMVRLEPESTPLSQASFPANARNWLQLSELDAQLYTATYLPLVTVPSGEVKNKPKRVEVIQCPMSLSACLELQTRGDDSEIRLAAHYIIPADKTIFNKSLQVSNHNEALVVTNLRGENVAVQDAIVIMLTGDSGRPIQGQRSPALPTWFSDAQLRSMGQVINDICTLLSQKDSEVKREECMSIGGEKGIKFRGQELRDDYRWGDIPDFDPTIFEAYVRSPSGLGAEIAFEVDQGKKYISAGENLSLTMLLDPQARTVELERLSRCQSGRVVWEPVRTKQIRNDRRITFQESYFDAGPNKNGEQFFRVRVYGKDTRLLGWSITNVLLRGYEEDLASASEKFCSSRNF